MSDAAGLREHVRLHWERLGGLCGGGCACDFQARERAAALAGYLPADFEGLPHAAAAHSFGCGTPVAAAGIVEGETIVDLGCGAGLDLVLAARRAGGAGSVTGVDFSGAMCAAARRFAVEAGCSRVSVTEGSIEDFPLESASVDCVVTNAALSLSPEKDRACAEIARVLRPGGRILLAEVTSLTLPGWARRNEALYCAGVAGALDGSGYLALLEAAGLEGLSLREARPYDAAGLGTFLQTALLGTDAPDGCSCNDYLTGRIARRMGEVLAGRVGRCHMAGRRPA